LGIPGKGDGASVRDKTLTGRRRLEKEYEILDDQTRRAKEVALARYRGFVICGGDGRLDYGTSSVSKNEEKKGKKKGCLIM
jgi:hypothetical protein